MAKGRTQEQENKIHKIYYGFVTTVTSRVWGPSPPHRVETPAPSALNLNQFHLFQI